LESRIAEWGKIYNFIEEDDFVDEYEYDVNDFEDIKKSKMHKVASRPTILPYYGMVRWIIFILILKLV